jgi:two-component system, OmpR family, sensor histidine kinase MtrB
MRTMPRGLRARSAAAFALLALVLSVSLSLVTYQLARWYLLEQRESLATRQVMINALVAKGLVAASDAEPDDVLASVRSLSNARAVLRVNDSWYAAVVELTESSIPEAFVDTVSSDGAARQRVAVNGVPYVLVGVVIPELDAAYYEFVPITEYRRTLETLLFVLAAGASVTTIGGALAGWFTSRRLMRPLADVASAARAMSAGDLTMRLDVDKDRDLEPVAESFNDMAASLEARISRELRFTADVSHELRTPLTAMASAVSLAKRAELTGRAEFAVGVLDEQVDHLRRLTLELLEISRIDAGVSELNLEEVDVVLSMLRSLEAAGVDHSCFRSRLGDDVIHLLDRTRFERVLANLLENADRYGGGCTAIEVERRDGDLVFWVDDAGPGVDPSERIAIFGRFHRGNIEQPVDRPKGTGLGLSLVEEHVHMHGGSVWVTDSPEGGARFVVRIPRSRS